MKQIPEDFSIEKATELASTPTGKAILAYLQNQLGGDSAKIADAVRNGDLQSIEDKLQKIAGDPTFRAMLRGEKP